MRCSRCKKWIEAGEIKFAKEGDWMGKPLCRRCKAQIEEESRNNYRRQRARKKQGSQRDLYKKDVYAAESNTENEESLDLSTRYLVEEELD